MKVIPPGFCEASFELRCSGDPDPWNIVCGFDISDYGGDHDAAATAINQGFEIWMNDMAARVTFTGCNLTIGQDGGDPLRQFFNSSGQTQGAGSGVRLPSNVALLVKKNTALGGRKHRGRSFLPLSVQPDWVSETGVLTPAALQALQGTSSAVFQAWNTLDAEQRATPLVILHNQENLGTEPDPTVVTSLTVDPVIATQRRRLR